DRKTALRQIDKDLADARASAYKARDEASRATRPEYDPTGGKGKGDGSVSITEDGISGGQGIGGGRDDRAQQMGDEKRARALREAGAAERGMTGENARAAIELDERQAAQKREMIEDEATARRQTLADSVVQESTETDEQARTEADNKARE